MNELKIKPEQKLRFAFWGAEESGLLGSEHYVDTLPDGELAKIYANLNFDMLGSPNYVRFVYDGDGSDTATPARPARRRSRRSSRSYFARQRLASEPTAFDGRSDYGPFIAAASPPVASSPAPRASRPLSRPPSTAAPRASPSTLLPRGLRHMTNLNVQRSERARRRGRARDPDARQVQVRPLPGRLPQGRPGQVQGQAVRQRGRPLAVLP